uniref:Sulfotransferase n=1 Tax=Knipowitschia caucasica TaxID=637954 RepID=A0AAV2IR61_KNICA
MRSTYGPSLFISTHSHRWLRDRYSLTWACRDLLWSLLQCDLHALENYIQPQPSKHLVNNLFCWDKDRVLCHTPICKPTHANWTEGDCKQCSPVNLTRAGEFCSTRSHVAYKTVHSGREGNVRLVVLDTVRPLLEDPRLNIKVLQLVRDPRGILNSRIDLFSSWYKPWYMLLRYEDIAMNPLQKTKEIYEFVGLKMTPSVAKWIDENTKSSTESKNKLGTKRDSATVTESWRRKLPLDLVLEAQKQCLHYMRLVGYRPIQSREDLLNMNVSTVEERLFEPFL